MPEFFLNPLFWALILLLLVQLLTYLLLFRRLAVYKQPEPEETQLPPVSVIVAARDEARNLKKFLQRILEQDYPDFEVIVIDDQSEDGTKELLEKMRIQYPHLKMVTITEHINEFAGKKLALTLGIKAAQHEILLFTDADCEPVTYRWIRRMVEPYANGSTEIVLGFSPYKTQSSFINLFIRYDTFYTALQYISFTLVGMPYMGVGRNLSYKRSLFFRNKGFAPFLKVSSGDDDLFVNHNATAQNVAIQLNPESFVVSKPKKTWSDWLRQKKRHIRSGKYYKSSHKSWLAFIWLSNLLFYAAVVFGIIFINPFWISLVILGMRWIVSVSIMAASLKKIRMSKMWYFTPFLDIVYQLIYYPVITIISLFSRKKQRW